MYALLMVPRSINNAHSSTNFVQESLIACGFVNIDNGSIGVFHGFVH
jgi:hypothetical protein